MVTNKQKEFNKVVMKRLKQIHSLTRLNEMSNYIDWDKEEIREPEDGWSEGTDKEDSLYHFLRGFTYNKDI